MRPKIQHNWPHTSIQFKKKIQYCQVFPPSIAFHVAGLGARFPPWRRNSRDISKTTAPIFPRFNGCVVARTNNRTVCGGVRFLDFDLVPHNSRAFEDRRRPRDEISPRSSPRSHYPSDLSSYKDVYRREAIGFSQPPSSTRRRRSLRGTRSVLCIRARVCTGWFDSRHPRQWKIVGQVPRRGIAKGIL